MENQNIEYLKAWTESVEKLCRPWKIALIVTNILWAAILAAWLFIPYEETVSTVQQDIVNEGDFQNVHQIGGDYGYSETDSN
jgi:hypothetical protein